VCASAVVALWRLQSGGPGYQATRLVQISLPDSHGQLLGRCGPPSGFSASVVPYGVHKKEHGYEANLSHEYEQVQNSCLV